MHEQPQRREPGHRMHARPEARGDKFPDGALFLGEGGGGVREPLRFRRTVRNETPGKNPPNGGTIVIIGSSGKKSTGMLING